MFIYLIENKINNKKYVGQTSKAIEERWQKHQKDTRTGRGQALHGAIQKYGAVNFNIRCLAAINYYQKDEAARWLNFLEPLFIKYYKTLAPNGYNLEIGGKHSPMHDITRAKLSKSLLGRSTWNKGKTGIYSAKTIAAISLGLTGKKQSPETIEKRIKKLIGKKHPPQTPEAKQKISKALKGRVAWNKGKSWTQAMRDAHNKKKLQQL